MVTGASSGIGRATALELARSGYHIVAAGRSATRIRRVVDQITEQGGSAEYLELDLASLQSARDAAGVFEQTEREIDVLVNCAGVGATHGRTKDGFEIHFGVNHLGHFMFTHHLRRTFAPSTRIVQVSSEVHRRADGINFDAVMRRTRSVFGITEYAVSKLANILFATEMAKRQPDWRLYAVHPGLTNTRIIPWYIRPLIARRILTPEQGADTIVWCARSPSVADDSGHYYARRSIEAPSAAAADNDLAKRLWTMSEKWCGVAPIDN